MSYEEIKSRLKEELINNNLTSLTLKTLGGKSEVSFSISENGENIEITTTSGKSSYPINENIFNAVRERYDFLPTTEKFISGQYNTEKWPDTPNHILAPYIPVLIRHYQV
ncbi:hypothetical protein SAMN04488519_1099 [Algoriphagus ornithinivorans]|uniref:Uncharacterized protein n=1 Tax=Algoriphagus ornithinivorans TaxID=226506 RepID=A0A1I5IIM0_9BACT|nr:hypothetical protein [Algoriphagus ornithinivorans]SFO60292.1 hypothetical protein SAMN04488519_1099 [Algoriphagus ornithinivorans]